MILYHGSDVEVNYSQIAFCSEESLKTLVFVKSYEAK